MNEAQRHLAILAMLEKQQALNVSDIIEAFDVSPATARRDITKLDEQGKLLKVRNGAERVGAPLKRSWMPLDREETDHFQEKARIAEQAASLCQPGDSLVINCGSTAFLLGQQLCGQEVQIVTNYFPLASYLIKEDHDDVIIIGGQYNKAQNILINPAPELFGSYAGHWMFTSGKGLTESGLYKADMLTAVGEQQMMEHIDKLVVVVDSSKVGARTGMLFCPLNKIDIVITGKEANPEVIAAIRAQGTEVMLV